MTRQHPLRRLRETFCALQTAVNAAREYRNAGAMRGDIGRTGNPPGAGIPL